MKYFLRHHLGWEESDSEIYRQCFNTYGGSINLHPDVLTFVNSRHYGKLNYYHLMRNKKILGAYALLDNKTIGARVFQDYPLSYDEVLLPVAEGCRVILPEKCNRLSPLQNKNFLNATYTLFRKNKICIARTSFSAKTERKRRNQYNRFLMAGGRCVDQSVFSSNELATIYVKLFKLRFKKTVKCFEHYNLQDIIENLRHLIFGHVLLVGDEPCAIDLVFYSESERMIYFDVPNGGLNPLYSHLSPGSLLMWKNILAARELCSFRNKRMRFSIGALEDEWNYKLQWSEASRTGKLIF